MNVADMVIALIFGYVVGATPFGYLAGRARGVDIRQHGSGNIGATNVLRVLGKPLGIAVFILDFAKGLLASLAALLILGSPLTGVAAGLGVILGHNYTFWLGFKGGKGIATSAGVLAGLMPIAACVGVAAWVGVFFATRYVSLASLAAAVSLPITTGVALLAGAGSWILFMLAAIMCGLATWRHRSNISRLRAGTEPRFERKPKVQHSETRANRVNGNGEGGA